MTLRVFLWGWMKNWKETEFLSRSRNWCWSLRLISKYKNPAHISSVRTTRWMQELQMCLSVETPRTSAAVTNICGFILRCSGLSHEALMHCVLEWLTVSSQLCVTPGYCFPAARMGKFSGLPLLPAQGADILLYLITEHAAGPQAATWTSMNKLP